MYGLPRQLVTEAVGEAGERELARRVRHEVRHADAAAYRRDVDNAAFALAAHTRNHREDPVERTPEMRVHRVLIVRQRHVRDRPDLNDAGVVDQDVDSPEPPVPLPAGSSAVVPAPAAAGARGPSADRLPGPNATAGPAQSP